MDSTGESTYLYFCRLNAFYWWNFCQFWLNFHKNLNFTKSKFKFPKTVNYKSVSLNAKKSIFRNWKTVVIRGAIKHIFSISVGLSDWGLRCLIHAFDAVCVACCYLFCADLWDHKEACLRCYWGKWTWLKDEIVFQETILVFLRLF